MAALTTSIPVNCALPTHSFSWRSVHTHVGFKQVVCVAVAALVIGGISCEWQSISWLTNIYPLPSNCQLYQIVTLLLNSDAIHLCPLPHHSCDLLHLRSCGAVGCAAADLGTPLQ